jgi:pyruvate formate lyase activating enzyme
LCLIQPGQSGECRVRINIDGVCNLHCKNCQNWEISQANPEDKNIPAYSCPPERLVALTKRNNCPSLAYTYTDPIVYYEYTYDSAKLAKDADIRNVLVTAGYINEQPWKQLLEYVDAANIDLKGISEDFYRQVCSATLKPVQNALILAKASGILVEVTNLIIPTLNDKSEQIRRLARWVKANLGSETPLHFSGFYPRYQMRNLPPTSLKALEMAREIAMSEGLNYVYIGNVASRQGQNTYCPGCKRLLIERSGYTILQNRLKNGICPDCGEEIYGVWK